MKALAATALACAAMVLPTRATGHGTLPLWKQTWWRAEATCIHLHESVDWHWGPSNHPRQSHWNGYWTGFQFLLGTWQSTFGPSESHGLTYNRPDLASPAEQYRRVSVVWLRNGHSFGANRQWPSSAAQCGVR